MNTDRELMQQALGYMESVGQMDMHPEEWAIAVALRERLVQPEQEPVAWNDENVIAYCLKRGIEAAKHIAPQPKEPEQEFITHKEGEDGWSEWVCPDPRGYLLKCCDCGLVHEAQFGVVRYKSETEREDCDMVDDPNLQAVFRMRRSEQWSPKDTAHRAGGLPMSDQPAQQSAQQQEPVAWMWRCKPYCNWPEWSVSLKRPADSGRDGHRRTEGYEDVPLYTSPPASKPWVGLTDEEWQEIDSSLNGKRDLARIFVRTIEAKLREKNHG